MNEIKTLTQLIAELPDDQTLHIGAKCNYFFCGTKAEYETDIDKVSDQLLEGMHAERRKLLARKKRFPTTYNKVAKLTPDTEDEETLKKLARAASTLANAANGIISANRRLPVVEQNIAEFKPVRGRNVLDFYPCLDEADGVNIIVEGCEEGRYWTVDEYRNGVVVETNDPEVGEDD